MSDEVWGWRDYFTELATFICSTQFRFQSASKQYTEYCINRLAKCYKNANAIKQSVEAYTLQNKNILQGSYKNADAVKQSVEAYSLQNNNVLYGIEQDFKCSPESINITNVCPVAAAF